MSNTDRRAELVESRAPGCAPTAASTAGPVFLAGKLTGLSAPGGGETQMLALLQALLAAGDAARLWRPWEDCLSQARCLHLFGSEPEHLPLVEAARRMGVSVVLSPITWFAWRDLWREPWSLGSRAWCTAKFAGRALLPRVPSWRRRLYHAVDLLLPNSNAEADQLRRYFQAPAERLHVVPNGAEPEFASADPEPFVKRVGCRGFVLYAGRIEPRKNQLGFLRAMQGADVPIVILGDPAPGHEAYADECKRLAGPRVIFVGRLDRGQHLLASAYAACGCLALASWYETPGLVALEAGMSGTPLVLPRGGCAREYFGPLARYVAPDDPVAIRKAVLAALAEGRNPALADLVQRNYSWAAAAAATRGAYAKAL